MLTNSLLTLAKPLLGSTDLLKSKSSAAGSERSAVSARPPVLVVPSRNAVYVEQKSNNDHISSNNNKLASSSLGFSFYGLSDYDKREKWCVGSCHGYLAYVSKLDSSFYFTNPFDPDDTRSISLPPIYEFPYLEIVRRDPVTGVPTQINLEHSKKTSFCRLGMARTFLTDLATSSSPADFDCTAIAVFAFPPNLTFCNFNSKSPSWIGLGERRRYTNVAYSTKDKLFYSCLFESTYFLVEVWDLNDDQNPKRVFEIMQEKGSLSRFPSHVDYLLNESIVETQCYFVDDSGDMLFVKRHVADVEEDAHGNLVPFFDDSCWKYRTIAFEVYKVDSKRRVLESVGGLGDRALFVGKNQAFCCPCQ